MQEMIIGSSFISALGLLKWFGHKTIEWILWLWDEWKSENGVTYGFVMSENLKKKKILRTSITYRGTLSHPDLLMEIATDNIICIAMKSTITHPKTIEKNIVDHDQKTKKKNDD